MKTKAKSGDSEPESARFQKVAECLYRHASSGNYYGLVKRSGKQYRRSLKTMDRKLAERSVADFRQKVGRLDHRKGRSDITFAEVAKQWHAALAPRLKPSSAKRRETSLIQLNRFFGAVPVRNLTANLCEQWLAKRGAAVAASTYNNERDTIIAVLNYATREGLLLDNPALVLPRRKLGRASITIPSRAQFETLVGKLRSLDSRYWQAADLVELLGYSGMRLAEATSITWSHVDFEQGRFVVTGGDVGTKNHDARAIPLFPAMRQFLERLRASRQPTPSDRIIGIDSAKNAIRHACKAADLPVFNHHCMRHYFVSNAIEAGVDFKTIAAWVGHKDGGLLVARTYGHLRDTHSFEMAKRMSFGVGFSSPAPSGDAF